MVVRLIAQQNHHPNLLSSGPVLIAEEAHTTPAAIIWQMDIERLSTRPRARPIKAYVLDVNKQVAARRRGIAKAQP